MQFSAQKSNLTHNGNKFDPKITSNDTKIFELIFSRSNNSKGHQNIHVATCKCEQSVIFSEFS